MTTALAPDQEQAAPVSLPALLTLPETAAALGVHFHTVYEWARVGKLAALRTPGGHRRYLREQVQAIRDGRDVPVVSLPEGDPQRLLTADAVGAWWRVDAKTVSRWAVAGDLAVAEYRGRGRRFRETDMLALALAGAR